MPQAPPSHNLTRRAEALDSLDAILPLDRRDLLAALLTDDDVDTLRHLARQGIGQNSLRALASDLAYLEAWCQAASGVPLPWPALSTADQIRRASPMGCRPARDRPGAWHARRCRQRFESRRLVAHAGPHAPSTVRRRLSSWSTLTQWRGLKGDFNAPGLRSAIKLAVRASARPRKRKSEKAVTADVLLSILKACEGERLVDLRDRALLLAAFASGGRRRSEVASLRVEQLVDQDPVPADPRNPDRGMLACAKIHLGRTKTTEADDDAFALLIGRPVLILREWLARTGITEGAIFRGIDRWEISSRAH
jgi:integrase